MTEGKCTIKLTKNRPLHSPDSLLPQPLQPPILIPQLAHLPPHRLPVPPSLYDLQPRIPYLRLQRHIRQLLDLLRSGRNGVVLAFEPNIPGLKDGFQGVDGAAVFVPLKGREEEFQDAGVEPGDGGLHLGSWVEDQVEGVPREEIGDLGDGGAEFGGRSSVVGDGLRMVIGLF